MNFKKYHVSKNLFDANDKTTIGTGVGYACNLVIGDTYTFTNLSSDTIGFKISNGIGGYNSVQQLSIAPNTSKTFTMARNPNIPPDATQYFFIIRNEVYGVEVNEGDIMLNTGSTPQLYEPYSSEVWHDIPYYIRKTDTDTLTLPQTIYGDGTAATIGLKGNTQQSGTPSPDNPIMPQGTGERTAQLFEDRISSCNIGADGKLTGNPSFDMLLAKVEQGVTYTASATITGGFFTTKPVIGSTSYDGQRMAFANATFTAPITGYLAFRVNAGNTAMINTGSQPLPYENYGYKIPILSNSSSTTVYLGEVETERKIQKLVLTGNEDIAQPAANIFRFNVNDYMRQNTNVPICSHYKGITPVSSVDGLGDKRIAFLISSSGNNYMYIRDSSYSSIPNFKTYLQQQYAAGTPVTVWYVLATAATGVVNEPLMKIGSYSDTLSTSIATTDGANALSIGTTVQPSEVTANYHGWHVGTVHEAENGQWD